MIIFQLNPTHKIESIKYFFMILLKTQIFEVWNNCSIIMWHITWLFSFTLSIFSNQLNNIISTRLTHFTQNISKKRRTNYRFYNYRIINIYKNIYILLIIIPCSQNQWLCDLARDLTYDLTYDLLTLLSQKFIKLIFIIIKLGIIGLPSL